MSRVIFNNSSTTKLELVRSNFFQGLLDFDGNPFVKVSNDPSASGDYFIEFDVWLDKTSGFNSIPYFIAIGSKGMGVKIDDSLNKIAYFYQGNTYRYECNIPSINTWHTFKLVWAESGSDLSFYINNQLQSKTVTTATGASGSNIWIGGWSTAGATNFDDIALKNVNLNDEHFYKGYPNGSSNSAWTDQIGSWNATIEASSPGTVTTRDIGTQSASINMTGYLPYLEWEAIDSGSVSWNFDQEATRNLTVIWPDGSKESGLHFVNTVATGDIIRFFIDGNDWNRLREITLGGSTTYVKINVRNSYKIFEFCKTLNYMYETEGIIPNSAKFPNCTTWMRLNTDVDYVITGDTFNSAMVSYYNNQYQDFDPATFSWYTYLNHVVVGSYKDGSSFQDLPVDRNILTITFPGTNIGGDLGTWLNAMNTANYDVRRISCGAYTSNESSVNLTNITATQGASICGYNQIPIDVGTIWNNPGTIGWISAKAVGTITGFTNPDGPYALHFYDSIIEGDLKEWSNCDVDRYSVYGIYIYNTRIVTYTKSGSYKPLYTRWYDCATGKTYGVIDYSDITEQTLVDLLDDKTSYAITNTQQNGQLYIGSNNPTITDSLALEQLELLSTATDVQISGGTYDGYYGLGWTVEANT